MRLFYAHKKLRKIASLVFCFLCIAFIVFSPSYVFDKDRYSLNLNKYLTSGQAKDVVLSLYHIETFEGGSASRSKYLQRQAQSFNKQNPNCYIVVKTLSLDELILNLQNGNIPDLFSFGTGAGEYIAGFMAELDKNSSIRNDLRSLGSKGGKTLCYPYMLSGYAIISKECLPIGDHDFSKLLQSKVNNKKIIKGISIGEQNTNPYHVLQINGVRTSKDNTQVFDSQ